MLRFYLGPVVLPLKARGVLLSFSKEQGKTPYFHREDTIGISSLVLKPLGWVSVPVLVLSDLTWPTVAQIIQRIEVLDQLLVPGKLADRGNKYRQRGTCLCTLSFSGAAAADAVQMLNLQSAPFLGFSYLNPVKLF